MFNFFKPKEKIETPAEKSFKFQRAKLEALAFYFGHVEWFNKRMGVKSLDRNNEAEAFRSETKDYDPTAVVAGQVPLNRNW